MTPLAAVRAALAALADTPAEQRRDRLCELMTASTAMQTEVDRLHDPATRNGWLMAAWAWLDAHAGHPEFAARENRYIETLEGYERMHGALADALRMVR